MRNRRGLPPQMTCKGPRTLLDAGTTDGKLEFDGILKGRDRGPGPPADVIVLAGVLE